MKGLLTRSPSRGSHSQGSLVCLPSVPPSTPAPRASNTNLHPPTPHPRPQVYVEALNAADRTVTVGDDFVLVSRASLMLRGLGHLLNQHRSAATAWAPIAERVLRAAGEDPRRVLQ